MYRLVRSAGWSKKDVLRAIAEGQLTGIQIRNPGRNGTLKWAIVHPGIQFLDYLRDEQTRMRYIAILSERDVAAILGRNRNYVRWLVRTRKIAFTHVTNANGAKGRIRFTPEAVRRYLIDTSGRDPKKRTELTSDALVEWFWRQMNLEPKPPTVDDELAWIDQMPEPERSRYIDRLLRLAEEGREQLRAAVEKSKT